MDVAGKQTAEKDEIEQEKPEKITIDSVPGLVLIKNFITKDEEDGLWVEINKKPWSNKLKRRVQQYGYEYDYYSRNAVTPTDPIPDFLTSIVEKIMKESLMAEKPDQCIINEYEPGQGINNHTDVPHLFGNEIISISLGSDIIMTFTSPDGKIISLLLPRRSLLLFKDEARYKWKHGILAREKDELEDGTVLTRSKRISLTFRYIVKNPDPPKEQSTS